MTAYLIASVVGAVFLGFVVTCAVRIRLADRRRVYQRGVHAGQALMAAHFDTNQQAVRWGAARMHSRFLALHQPPPDQRLVERNIQFTREGIHDRDGVVR